MDVKLMQGCFCFIGWEAFPPLGRILHCRGVICSPLQDVALEGKYIFAPLCYMLNLFNSNATSLQDSAFENGKKQVLLSP